jgi:hypothetical protein
MSASSALSVRPRRDSRRIAALSAAIAAALFLIVNAVLAAIAPEAMGDHSTGPGRISEALAGLSFIAGGLAIAALVPTGAFARAVWILAVAGCAACGITMLAVVVSTVEPPAEVVMVEVAVTAIALIVTAIVGGIRRVWPWWVAAGVALLLPIMFLLPLNSIFMAAIWLAVAIWARPVEIPRNQ